MSIDSCAALVQRGDPDRFLAAMAAPPKARPALFVLYAYNLEVARAPWVTAEPMIAEMRLQFWRDVSDEIAKGAKPRAHEVADPLAAIVQSEHAGLLDQMAAARRWDIYRDAFEDAAHFDEYISHTAGNLTWLTALALGARADDEPPIRDMAYGAGIANFLRAVPELENQGRIPLVDGRAEAVGALARAALDRFIAGKKQQRTIAKAVRPALFALWRTEPLLRAVIADPLRVVAGALEESEVKRRGRLIFTSMRGML